MAFVPDEALDHASDVSKTAFALYVFICRWRNHKHKNAILNIAAARATLGLSQSQIYRALAELKTASWIVAKQNFVTPVKGSFSPKDKSKSDSQICEPDSQICEPVSQICENTPYSILPLNPAFKINQRRERPRIDHEPPERIAALICAQKPELKPQRTQIAVYETLMRRPNPHEPISSLRYFEREIQKWHSDAAIRSDELAEQILKHRKEQYERWITQH